VIILKDEKQKARPIMSFRFLALNVKSGARVNKIRAKTWASLLEEGIGKDFVFLH